MLQIRDIRKQYVTGELVQTALDGVSLNLRDNEFVAIPGPSGSGKTTLLNALKETLPDDMAILVAQQADELTTLFHPDMMFLHSLPGASESSVNYDLKHISIAGLTMDVDFFFI